jgi:recombination protein RecA
MPTAQHLRAQIEATLAEKIPSALTPLPQVPYSLVSTGIREIDDLLHGGLPAGAISEIVGPECSGRTSLALALVAGMTRAGKVCAWVDVSDTLHPESAAAIGVDLARLLWIRCGVPPCKEPLPLASVGGFSVAEKPPKPKPGLPQAAGKKPTPLDKSRSKSWSRLAQALRVTDLLLQAGGFSSIVLDMGSLNAEFALRVPLATWFRFRAAAERLQANVLLLTQHACAKSSAALVLRLDPGGVLTQDSTIFTGLEHRAEVARQRSAGNVLPLRKPPQSVHTAQWQAPWAGRR